ncbi:hypothetical protein MLD38_034878 [Melastoma candidum]|uniref:Uncharacterized protein n=1 Tax=Melastoma candidum TaxID=119954 RepID=A0ACB9MB32_9MYRT|nr:hypothetical protein MLD38_034878 [Melastoma candidum]
MGPCRSYTRDRDAFYNYRDDQDQVENEDDGKSLMPGKEELKGALKCINPRYTEQDVERILEYALRSRTVSDIIISCAAEHGFKGKFPSSSSIQLTAK